MHDRLLEGFIADHNAAIHPLVPGRMNAIVDRIGQIDRGGAGFFLLATDRFGDSRYQQRIEGADGVHTVVFGAADRDKHNVVFPSILNHLLANRILDVGSGLFDLPR